MYSYNRPCQYLQLYFLPCDFFRICKKREAANKTSTFKNENYFTLDNISKYGHITLKVLSVGIFTGLLQYFPKDRAILVQKLGKKKVNWVRP